MQIQLPGVTLEAEYLPPPEQKAENNKLAVCLHPWSWLGGRMNDPVLGTLTEPLHAKNYHIIRYNSRGVGGSTGWASFTGLKEGEDLSALVDWAMKHLNVPDIRTVAIIGYSHGSLIASLCPVLPSPIKTFYILISYPLGVRGWLTMFRTSIYATKLKELVDHSNSNVLVVFGDQDEFTSKTVYEKWAESIHSGNLDIERREGASHFWIGRHGFWLKERVERWLP